MKQIAVLLTVYNRKIKTSECLKNVYSQALPSGFTLDVYITDGGSSDGTVESVRHQFPDVNLEIQNNVYWNRGMWHSWDRASKTKDYDYYLWLNDDTYLFEAAVLSLLSVSSQFEDNAIVTGATVDSVTQSTVTYGGRNASGLVIPDGKIEPVGCINGNIVLVPRNVFAKVGNLDFYFTHSKGDFDYGKRSLALGVKMYQAGNPLGICDRHESIDKWCDPAVPLRERWRLMNLPNGMPPKETFHLDHRHEGLMTAFFHWMTIYIRCLLPQIWVKMGKARVG